MSTDAQTRPRAGDVDLPSFAGRRSDRRRSIQAKFIGLTVPLLMVFFLAVLSAHQYYRYVKTCDELRVRVDHFVASRSIILAEPIAIGSIDQVSLILASMIADPDIVNITIYDSENRTIHSYGVADPDALVYWKKSSITFADDYGVRAVGYLEVKVGNQRIFREMKENFAFNAAVGGVLIFLASVIAIVAYRRIVGAPIERLRTAFSKAKSGEDRTIEEWVANDEMGDLFRAYNDMQIRLQTEENALRKMKLELETRVRQRTAQLEFAHRELQEKEERVRAIVETVAEGIITTDERGIVETLNPAAESIFGKAAQDVVGRNVDMLMLSRYHDRLGADLRLRRAVDWPEMMGIEEEVVGRRDDGSEFPMELVVNEMTIDRNQMFTWVVRDITDRKKAENDLKDSERRHRAFAADIAHELRTPLSVLHLHLNELGASEAVDAFRRDVSSMSRLVEQLLALARLDNIELDFDDGVDLVEVCRKVARNLAPLAVRGRRSIEFLGTPGPVVVRGDSDALEQAVRNLMENAVKFSHIGTTITIEVFETGKIAIIDRGGGVPREMRDRIFERFQRSDQIAGGSGLGLSIVRQIVEAHEGRVTVDDTPGGGATFTVDLPIAA